MSFLRNFLIIKLLSIQLVKVVGQTNDGANFKIDPGLFAHLSKGLRADIFVTFGSTSLTLHTEKSKRDVKREAGVGVREALQKLVDSDQRGVVEIMSQKGRNLGGAEEITYEQMWISNTLYATNVDLDLVERIALDPKVTHVDKEQVISLTPLSSAQAESPASSSSRTGIVNVTWGIAKIHAPEAWEELGGQDKAGEGVVVGIMDSGVVPDHEALRDKFVGQYGWFDPYNMSVENPNDYCGRGSHAAGIAVGKMGIGVAPAAKYSGCRACFSRYCNEYAAIKCAQFFICPTLPDGSQEDCTKKVDVVNLAIGQYFMFPGQAGSWFDSSVEALLAANVIPVASAGNEANFCKKIFYPGLLENVITVASFEPNGEHSTFSAKGPSYKGFMKPDILAPGNDIQSVKQDNDEPYMSLGGTEQAVPHVTGVVALLRTRDKNITFEQVRDLIRNNADTDFPEKQGPNPCRIHYKAIPNGAYGWGRLNALNTIKAQSILLNNSTRT